jgi:hypothetical protein
MVNVIHGIITVYYKNTWGAEDLNLLKVVVRGVFWGR